MGAVKGTVLLFLSPCTHHEIWIGTAHHSPGILALMKRKIQASAVTQLSYTEDEHD